MRVYAVVGGIGAGKSTVCRWLAARGAVVVDADRIGHQVLRQARVRQRLLAAFGADIVGPGGEIDRRRLAAKVFGDAERLATLNAIVHPEIGRRLRRRLRDLERRGVRVVVLDAALFLDADLQVPVDGVIAVTAPRRLRRRRIRTRDGWSSAEIEARLDSQKRLGVWTRQADYRIDTSGSLQDTEKQVDRLWRRLQAGRGSRRQRSGG